MGAETIESCSQTIPILDVSPCISHNFKDLCDIHYELCKQISESLKATGCLVVKCPLVNSLDNDNFLDMMETYFCQPTEAKLLDSRPELHYQVGVTPCGTERPRYLEDTCMQRDVGYLEPDQRPSIPEGADHKWRYMWRVGPRPAATDYPELNSLPVIPKGFPQWSSIMDSWGSKLVAAARLVATMAAVGFNLSPDAFEGLLEGGPHMLAPTGSDLGTHNKLGTVLAGYHYDLNFLTLHGPCRFPGLHIWCRDGRRLALKIPPGCLLIQAGRQFEWLTGGEVLAGMHEVVVTDATCKAIAAAREAGRPLWRVSSTVFTHIASDVVLQPLGHFGTPEALARYPPTKAGQQVACELEATGLKVKP